MIYTYSLFRNSIKVLRPKQWIKNLLVFAAPLAALSATNFLVECILGFLAFNFASSIGYLINDWKDKALDKNHPEKKYRPFAADKLTKRDFLLILFICLIFVTIICAYLPINFSFCIIAYLVVSISYSLILKEVPIIELVFVSTGFLIRAISGSTIIAEQPTGWFLVVIYFGSLFIVSCKRLSEFTRERATESRKVLANYDTQFLNLIINSSATICMLTYALWVFEIHMDSVLARISVITFSTSIFLYNWVTNFKKEEAPEKVFLHNRPFLLFCILHLLLLFGIFYL